MDILGVLGLLFIVIGFGYQMVDTIKKRKCNISRPVLGLFIVAGLLLFYYAFSIENEIFMVLNLAVVGINAVNFYYA